MSGKAVKFEKNCGEKDKSKKIDRTNFLKYFSNNPLLFLQK